MRIEDKYEAICAIVAEWIAENSVENLREAESTDAVRALGAMHAIGAICGIGEEEQDHDESDEDTFPLIHGIVNGLWNITHQEQDDGKT